MNFLKPFKLHYFSYRKIYFVSFMFFVFATLITVYLLKDFGIFYHFTIFFIALVLLLSFAVGFYEYYHLCDHYLNLKTNRFSFFLSSLSFGFINALIKTGFAAFVFWLLSISKESYHGTLIVYVSLFPYLKISTFLLLFTLNVLIYLIANFFALLLRKIRFGRVLLNFLILITISIYFQKIVLFLYENTTVFFTSPSLTIYLPFLWFIIIVFSLLVTWQASVIDLKK